MDTFALASPQLWEATPHWPTGRVPLLGDAVHATTPVGGTGANTALRDAALLSARLREVARGRSDLTSGIRPFRP